MKAWIIHQHGELDVLKNEEVTKPTPGPGEALVQVRAVGLNHLDLWVRKGVPGHKFPLPIIPGGDIAGIIESFGALSERDTISLQKAGLALGASVVINPILSCGRCPSCQGGFQPLCPDFGLLGETVNGGCAEYVSVPVENLLLVPKGISFQDVVCLPTAYVTAWSMLTRKTALRAGEVALIQAGGSGVSIAAIQMAKMIGATVITTVGSSAKESQARALGADYVIRYREQNFRDELKKALILIGRKGVDVAVDHVGADTFSDSIRSLAWGGRLVTCGATSGSKVEFDLKPFFFKNLSIHGATMGSRTDLFHLLDLLRLGKIKTVIDSTFSMSDLKKAHARLESRDAFGKVVVLK